MEEDSFNEYFAQKNRIFNNIEDNQIVLSDDDDIILSDDDTKEYNNLDKMDQFDKDYPQYEEDDDHDIYIRNLILKKITDKDINDKEPTNKEPTNKDINDKELTNKDINNKEPTNKEPTNKDINNKEPTNKEPTNNKKNKNNKMRLCELDTLISKIEEDKKPKKFISRRSQEKIQQSQEKLQQSQEKIQDKQVQPIKRVKRTFNARLVPYFQSNEYKSLQNRSFTLDDFPKL